MTCPRRGHVRGTCPPNRQTSTPSQNCCDQVPIDPIFEVCPAIALRERCFADRTAVRDKPRKSLPDLSSASQPCTPRWAECGAVRSQARVSAASGGASPFSTGCRQSLGPSLPAWREPMPTANPSNGQCLAA